MLISIHNCPSCGWFGSYSEMWKPSTRRLSIDNYGWHTLSSVHDDPCQVGFLFLKCGKWTILHVKKNHIYHMSFHVNSPVHYPPGLGLKRVRWGLQCGCQRLWPIATSNHGRACCACIFFIFILLNFICKWRAEIFLRWPAHLFYLFWGQTAIFDIRLTNIPEHSLRERHALFGSR